MSTNPDDAHWTGLGQHGLNGQVFALTVYDSSVVAGGTFTRSGVGDTLPRVGQWHGQSWTGAGSSIDIDRWGDIDCYGQCAPFCQFCYPSIQAVTVWNGYLIAAGHFTSIGGVRASCIARWDGNAWHRLAGGMNDDVYDLTVYKGDLIAGGRFTQADGMPASRIARWDGNAWHALGDGIEGEPLALAVYNGELIAGGGFYLPGGARTAVLHWDGNSWGALGALFDDWSVRALTVFEGELIAAGDFYHIGGEVIGTVARWNGTAWRAFEALPPGDMSAMAVYNGKLIVGGRFVGNSIARWSGSEWEPLGSGLNENVAALTVWNGSLFVGGRFTTAGDKPSKGMARWDDVITAVEVQDLEANTLAAGVQLRWRLSADALRSVTGILVQRAGSREGPYQDVTSPALTPETWMSYVDATAQPGAAYWYRLLLVLGEVSVQTAGPIAILANPQAWETKLYPPRIEGDAVELRYTIGTARTPVQLEIFDPRGRLIRTVASGIQELGQHSQFWDARNIAGSRVARGVYLVHLSTDRTRATQKLVLFAH